MAEDKNIPGFHTEEVARIPSDQVSHEDMEQIHRLPGHDTDFVESPQGKREVVVKVTKLVLPKNNTQQANPKPSGSGGSPTPPESPGQK